MTDLICAQYMKWRKYVTQQGGSEGGLMTKLMQFMQQVISPLPEGDDNIYNSDLLQSIYVINTQKSK